MNSNWDAVPYTSLPSPERVPERLRVVGLLTGMNPAPAGGCRVLELGCGTGTELLALAQAYPGAELLGIELSAAAAEQAQAAACELGLSNVRVEARSILDFNPRAGRFDYILCHGVFSWVSHAVQSKIFAICAAHLAEQGLACISYNALPAWTYRSVLREALKRFVPGAKDLSSVRKAREVFDVLLETLQESASPYAMALRLEIEQSKRSSDGFILHELLADGVSACYLDEFLARAERAGLHYLSEARYERNLAERLEHSEESADLQKLVGAAGVRGQREQLLDFLYPTWLRQAVLTHAASGRIQSQTARNERGAPKAEVLKSLWISSPLVPADAHEGPDDYMSPRGEAVTIRSLRLKAMLKELIAVWPAWIPIPELCARTAEGSEDLPQGAADELFALFRRGLVELHSSAPPFTVTPLERSELAPLARRQIPSQQWVTNLRHEYTVLSEFERQCGALVDGTRTRAEILEALEKQLAAGQIEVKAEFREAAAGQSAESLLGQALDETLVRFGENALLRVPCPAAAKMSPPDAPRDSVWSRLGWSRLGKAKEKLMGGR